MMIMLTLTWCGKCWTLKFGKDQLRLAQQKERRMAKKQNEIEQLITTLESGYLASQGMSLKSKAYGHNLKE